MEEKQYKKRGPKKKIMEARREYHLKFSDSIAKAIEEVSPQGVQAYFDELVKQDSRIIEIQKRDAPTTL